MDLNFFPIILFLVVADKIAGQQIISVIPTTSSLGQTLLSSVPVTGQQYLTAATPASIQQPSLIQLLRQPSYYPSLTQTQLVGQPGTTFTQLVGQSSPLPQVVGGQLGTITQLVGQSPSVSLPQVISGQPGTTLTQLVGQPVSLPQLVGSQAALLPQSNVVGGGLQLLTTAPGSVGLTGANNVLSLVPPTSATGIPYPYTSSIGVGEHLTTTNVNGIPLVLPGTTGGVGVNLINNGLQTYSTVPVPATTVIEQPLVGVGPVVRQVPADEVISEDVQLDPMDAALKEMENKGQIHMEKYAWGRSALPNTNNGDRERKAELPMYYAPLLPPTPTGVVTLPSTVIPNNRYVQPQIQTRTRNPFLGADGKRKKHFELYEYFRNLDLTSTPSSQPLYVPVSLAAPVPASTSPFLVSGHFLVDVDDSKSRETPTGGLLATTNNMP